MFGQRVIDVVQSLREKFSEFPEVVTHEFRAEHYCSFIFKHESLDSFCICHYRIGPQDEQGARFFIDAEENHYTQHSVFVFQ
jgi:hypothetical protein